MVPLLKLSYNFATALDGVLDMAYLLVPIFGDGSEEYHLMHRVCIKLLCNMVTFFLYCYIFLVLVTEVYLLLHFCKKILLNASKYSTDNILTYYDDNNTTIYVELVINLI